MGNLYRCLGFNQLRDILETNLTIIIITNNLNLIYNIIIYSAIMFIAYKCKFEVKHILVGLMEIK